MPYQNIIEKSMRSVFVGNIPYDTTEEKLKDIFNDVGPVLSFKLMYYKESGKPRGYGFCEYKDQETALSALRNLNGFEIGGRTLRVDNACTEKSRLEMQSLMMGISTSESQYGEAVDAEKAPEVINKMISTLPQEQLDELMKQMKECIKDNPVEARKMLLQNPQLSYALLQAQVVMNIVDPETAKSMLHPVHKVPQPLYTSNAESTSKDQLMPQTSNNDWQHNTRQNTSQDLRQPLIQMSFPPPPPVLLSNNKPPQLYYKYNAARDYLQTSAMESDNRSFGDVNSDHRVDSNFMTIPPPMIVKQHILPEQQVPTQMIQTSQPQALQASNQISKTSDSEKIAKLPNEQHQSILQLKDKISNSSEKKD